MTRHAPHARPFLRTWLIWTAGFLAFPIAGLAGTAVAGRVDDPAGGVARRRGRRAGRSAPARRWSAADASTRAGGCRPPRSAWASASCSAPAAVDYRTSLADLALMGALTGVVLGAAQALALPRRDPTRWVWAAAMPVLWALGWTVTTLGGIARRGTVHDLRRLRSGDVLRPVRARCCTGSCPTAPPTSPIPARTRIEATA